MPTNTIAQALANIDVRVILGLIMRPTLNCNRRRARNIDNDIKNQYCDTIKDINQDYNLGNKKITVVKILDENTKGGNLKSGDFFIGTSNGLYFLWKRNDVINLKKIEYIGGEITNLNPIWVNGPHHIIK